VDVFRFETMPSSPILQACANTVGPSASMCSLNRRPGAARLNTDANVAFLVSSGSRRRSSPFNSIRSKAYRNAGVVAAVADVLEAHHAFAVTDHGLAVDDAGSRAQPSHGFDNEGKTVGELPGRL
jgi:hypothetical protein